MKGFWRRRRRALVCRQAVALMTTYLDGQLSLTDSQRLEAHLSECPHCSEYLAQLRQTIRVLGHVDPSDLPAQVMDDLVETYRRWQASTPS